MKKIIVILVIVFTIMLSGCANEKINQSQKQEGNTTKNSSEESNLKTEIKSNLSGYKVTFASKGEGDSSDIWMSDVDGRNEKRLTNGKGHDIYPEWSGDGAYVYYTGDKHGGALELYRVNTKGEPIPEQITLLGKEVRSISVSKDNSMVALGVMSTAVPVGADLKDYCADLFVIQIAKVEKALKEGKLITLEDLTLVSAEDPEKHIWHEQPCFQKTEGDNPYIAYVRTENYDNDPIMKDDLWMVRADGSDKKEFSKEGSMPQWTFDDTKIVTHEFKVIDVNTKETKLLKVDNRAQDAGAASISPDGQYVIFETGDSEDRKSGLAKVIYEGEDTPNPIVLFSERPAFEPRWSPVPIKE
jgi:Tol biopolymer transport system component